MEKKIQIWSLLIGLAAYGSSLMLMFTNASNSSLSLIFSGLMTFGAGCFRANASRFFSGAMLALCGWAAYFSRGATERERSYIGIIMLLMFAVTLSVGAIAFFAGFLTRTIAEHLVRSKAPAETSP